MKSERVRCDRAEKLEIRGAMAASILEWIANVSLRQQLCERLSLAAIVPISIYFFACVPCTARVIGKVL